MKDMKQQNIEYDVKLQVDAYVTLQYYDNACGQRFENDEWVLEHDLPGHSPRRRMFECHKIKHIGKPINNEVEEYFTGVTPKLPVVSLIYKPEHNADLETYYVVCDDIDKLRKQIERAKAMAYRINERLDLTIKPIVDEYNN